MADVEVKIDMAKEPAKKHESMPRVEIAQDPNDGHFTVKLSDEDSNIEIVMTGPVADSFVECCMEIERTVPRRPLLDLPSTPSAVVRTLMGAQWIIAMMCVATGNAHINITRNLEPANLRVGMMVGRPK